MRILTAFIIIFYTFTSFTKANDINEFEIEGLSIGDSLLKFMNFDEIKKAEENKNEYPDSNYIVIFYNRKSEIYDDIEIVYDQKDTSFTIQALTGSLEDANNYKQCKIKKKDIVSEFKITFEGSEVYDDESEHAFSKGSLTDVTDFYPKTGGFARVSCTDWSEKAEKENFWVDNLKVSLGSEKFLLYLNKY
jgi:hypothetical protein